MLLSLENVLQLSLFRIVDNFILRLCISLYHSYISLMYKDLQTIPILWISLYKDCG